MVVKQHVTMPSRDIILAQCRSLKRTSWRRMPIFDAYFPDRSAATYAAHSCMSNRRRSKRSVRKWCINQESDNTHPVPVPVE